jgi:hypothetical protein
MHVRGLADGAFRESALVEAGRLDAATGSSAAVDVIRTDAGIESDNGRRYRNQVRYRRRSVDDLAGQVTPILR